MQRATRDKLFKLKKTTAQQELSRKYDRLARLASLALRRRYPHLAGVLIQGSVARGEPGPFSDIDLIGVIRHGKKPSDFNYYDNDVYVAVAFQTVADLKKEFKDPRQFFWARGSAKTSTRILYDPIGVLRRIMRMGSDSNPSRQILERTLWHDYRSIIEYSGKLRNGWVRRDPYQMRYAARVIAQHVEYSVVALNDISIISENNVWKQVLKAKRKPKHFGTDYPLALGIKGTADDGRVYRAAMRLCKETLRIVREFVIEAKHEKFRALLTEPLERHGL